MSFIPRLTNAKPGSSIALTGPGGSPPVKSGSTRLDPYGVYGTRSANRVLLARRRRRLQNLLAICVFLAVAAFALTGIRYRRIPAGTLQGGAQLRGRPAGPMASTSDGSLLVPSWSGELLLVPPLQNGRYWPDGAAGNPVRGRPVLSAAFPLRAQPAVHGEVAYVACEDGTLYAVNWKTGNTLWQYSGGVPLSCAPALVQMPSGRATVVQGDDEGLLVGLDAASGRMLWRLRAPGPVGNGIAQVPGTMRLLVPLLPGRTSGGGVLCLDGTMGKVVWRFPARDTHFSPVVAPPATVAAGPVGATVFGTDEGHVVRLDLANGKIEPGWKVAVSSQPGGETAGVDLLPDSRPVLLRSGALVMENHKLVVVGGNDGGVRGVDLETGALRWLVGTGGPVRLAPQLLPGAAQDTLAVAADNGTVWAISARGEVQKRWNLPGAPASLQALDKTLLAVTQEGLLFGLEP